MNVRKTGLLALGVAMVVGVLLGVKASAGAAYIATEQGTSSVAKGQVVDGSAYLAGNSVVVDGTVNGDVYCAGNTVRVDGVVNGDVLCAGNTITVDGKVNGDVRVAGASVRLAGVITGNATVGAADVVAEDSLRLGGDLTGGASSLTINGMVGRDMTAGASSLTINGTIGRDVRTGYESVSFGSDASVGGNFVYGSRQESDIPKDVIAGKTEFHLQQDNSTTTVSPVVASIGIALAVAVLAIVGSAIFPRQVHNVANVSWGMFGLSVALGLSFVMIAPLVAVILLATGVGAILAYVLFLAWLLLMAISPVFFAYFVGSKIYGSNSKNIVLRALVGALVLLIALLIPVLNILVFITMLLVGSGMLLIFLPKLYTGTPYQAPEQKAAKTKKAASA